ncbi:MAG TPA: MOSC N-terminal beta barrel domain-containing protein [Candidatus Paceibacterota bacterium]
MITVTGLFNYPMKGCEAVPVARLNFHNGNPHGDHDWMVVDNDGVFISARNEPRICLIRAHNGPDGSLVLSAHGVLGLRVETPKLENVVEVHLHGEILQALDCGDRAAEWLSKFLGTRSRLVKRHWRLPRKKKIRTARPDDLQSVEDVEVSFADAYPVLLVGEESVAALSSHIGRNLSILRFRPTVVVSGEKAFAEDAWRDMRFEGGHHPPSHLRGIKLCSRCRVPWVNPLTGEIDEPGILDALIEMGRVLPKYPGHPDLGSGAMLGMNCIFVSVSDGNSIAVGDELTVLSRW